MNRYTLMSLSSALVLAACNAQAQQDPKAVSYTVSFPNAAHHEAEIDVAFRGVADGPLTVRMSRASPGRYAIHEFAKNVYGVSATDAAGKALNISQTDPYSWVIDGHSGAVNLTYTLFADRADGTYSQIDRTHAHLNAPATFMWAEGMETRPVQVTFEPLSSDWIAATQLQATKDPMQFNAPDLDYFLDSPVKLTKMDIRSWEIADGQTIRLAVHHSGDAEHVSKLLEKTKKVVDEQIKVFGEAPQFDYGVYTFLAAYVAQASRDGMEHRNSTILSRPDGLEESNYAHLGTISHEFFHAWNVERIRPADLEPFNFTDANPSQSLWFAEGFTSYYGPLTIRRAGEQSVADYVDGLGRTLSRIINAPGRRLRGPAAMSLRAPFVDASTSIDPTNNANTFVSYYPYGAMIGLALDLTLRTQFEGVTLDDYMRLVWTKYGTSEKPYTNDDLQGALADLTGDEDFAARFFDTHIHTGEMPDYVPLFAAAGLTFGPSAPEAAWLGAAQLSNNDGKVEISSSTLRGTPLYLAGLDQGDEIIRIGRQKITRTEDIDAVLGANPAGTSLAIEYRQRGVVRTSNIVLAADPTLSLSFVETPTNAQLAFRADWLGTD